MYVVFLTCVGPNSFVGLVLSEFGVWFWVIRGVKCLFGRQKGQPTFDTESCDFSCLTTGCSIPEAINFDPYADGNHDDTCTFIGCQDTEAINFDPNANYPGECIYLDPCPGDFSGDGVVDIVDLLDLFTMWDDVCTWVID